MLLNENDKEDISNTWMLYFKNTLDTCDLEVERKIFADISEKLYKKTKEEYTQLQAKGAIIKGEDGKFNVLEKYVQILEYTYSKIHALSELNINSLNFRNYFLSVSIIIDIFDKLKPLSTIKDMLKIKLNMDSLEELSGQDFYDLDKTSYIRDFNNNIKILEHFIELFESIRYCFTQLDKLFVNLSDRTISIDSNPIYMPSTENVIKSISIVADYIAKNGNEPRSVARWSKFRQAFYEEKIKGIAGKVKINIADQFRDTVLNQLQSGLQTLKRLYEENRDDKMIHSFYQLFKFDMSDEKRADLYSGLQTIIEAYTYGPYGRFNPDIQTTKPNELLLRIKMKLIDSHETIATTPKERDRLVSSETYKRNALYAVHYQKTANEIRKLPVVQKGTVLTNDEGYRTFVIDKYVFYNNDREFLIDIVENYIQLRKTLTNESKNDILTFANYDVHSIRETGAEKLKNSDQNRPRIIFLLSKFIFLIIDDLEMQLSKLDTTSEFDDGTMFKLAFIYNIYENTIKKLFVKELPQGMNTEISLDNTSDLVEMTQTDIHLIDKHLETIVNLYKTNPTDFKDVNNINQLSQSDIKQLIINLIKILQEYRFNLMEKYYVEYYVFDKDYFGSISEEMAKNIIRKIKTKTMSINDVFEVQNNSMRGGTCKRVVSKQRNRTRKLKRST
jgi:hypothetical protein